MSSSSGPTGRHRRASRRFLVEDLDAAPALAEAAAVDEPVVGSVAGAFSGLTISPTVVDPSLASYAWARLCITQ